ncbi:hypothetical protein BGX31_009402 [Mortierella sp. GBA43]|nr:hypothetical protein BGX31_009402 [Mortierella sp. GBA43]
MYTLRIYDGAIGRSGSSRPGYLTTYIGLKFGLYIRDQGAQSDPNVCATCDFASTKNSAMRTMVPAFSTLVLAVMSTLSLMH